jgi:hypothetical protein
MSSMEQVNTALAAWYARLFYPRTKRGPAADDPRLPMPHAKASPAEIRDHIRRVVRGAPVVMVKITGTPTGMRGIRSHLSYITERGEPLHDEQGREYRTPDEVRTFGDHLRYAGSPIPVDGSRREAFALALDIPAGDARAVQAAAVEFAQREFAGHRWAWAFHSHQGHPHVHLIVRAEGWRGKRLDPRKADLHRWREVFAQALRARGVEADATNRMVRGTVRDKEPIYVTRARAAGTLEREHPLRGRVTVKAQTIERALQAWGHIHAALAASPDTADQALAQEVRAFVERMPMVEHLAGMPRQRVQEKQRQSVVQVPQQGQEPEPGR